MSIAEMIRAARLDAGLTQHELAQRVGVNEGSYVSRWERGERIPTVTRMRRLLSVLPLDEDETWRVWEEARKPLP